LIVLIPLFLVFTIFHFVYVVQAPLRCVESIRDAPIGTIWAVPVFCAAVSLMLGVWFVDSCPVFFLWFWLPLFFLFY
jgi:hypothetical protein